MCSIMRMLIFPSVAAVLAGIAIFLWGGFAALMLLLLLATLETTLSFDNAVVNAKVLSRMNARWQQRFLTWGIPIAVFGTRLVLPVIIVALAAGLSPIAVVWLAIFDPVHYSEYLHAAHVSIAAFGSVFLLLVSFKYFFNDRKTVHWIVLIERWLSRWGGIEAIEIALVLTILLLATLIAPLKAAEILVAGLVGVILFVIIQGIAQSFEAGATKSADMAAKAGVALFIYLNVLDSAFSLDGVVAAFAISTSVPIIALGLGVGALFVRSFTIMLVRAKTLETLVYLEHGAHYAILGLAIAMLVGIFVEVPEAITGLIGFVFIGFAYLSSRREFLRTRGVHMQL
ncbi:MAG TPA: DUF475 domain-containing protein [Candidatus Paceibacterota bacterium]